MTDQTGGSLNAAYEAIKAKDLPKARDLLSAYLVDHSNDVDAWWLYSYAVTDVEQARKALETVLRLDPAYPGARDLLLELEEAAPQEATEAPASRVADVSSLRPLAARSTDVAPLTTTIRPDDDLEDARGSIAVPGNDSTFSRTLLAIVAAIIILLIFAAIVILPNLNQPGASVADATNTVAATDTSIGFAVTDEATNDSLEATSESPETTNEAPTEQSPTVEASLAADASPEPTTETIDSEPLETVYNALASFDVVPDSAELETTELGETVAVSVCATTSELRSLVPAALTAVALSSSQVPSGAQALGVKFVNCSDNTVLRYVALSITDAQAYAAGTLTDADLRSRFIPLP